MINKVQKEHKIGSIENVIEDNAGVIVSIFLFSAFVAFTIFIMKQFFSKNDEILSMANSVILFWTGVILIWYTWETSKLRKEAQRQVEESQRQIEIQLRPFVVLDIGFTTAPDVDRKDYHIGVKNVGNGTAVNVVVKDMTEITSENIRVPYNIPQKPIHILSPNEYCTILYERNAETTTLITIEFQNVEGQLYFVKQTISPNSLEIGFGKI
jgi:hypothetical protein